MINNSLLEDIRRQNLELKMSMENVKYFNSQLPSIHTLLSEDTGFKGDEEDFSDSDTLDSTFDPASQSSSDETYGTASVSRESTPSNRTEASTSIINNASKSSLTRDYPLVKAPQVSKSDDSRYNLRSRKTARL